MKKKKRLVKIAGDINEIDFGKNSISEINVDGKTICLIKTLNGLKACASKCPHASGDLSAGFLDKKENIICAVHNYRFNLNNGRDTNGEGYFLKIFQVKESENGIFIELE